MSGLPSDFWWLDKSQIDRFIYLELGHSERVDEYTKPTINTEVCHISYVDKFRNRFHNTNVYRSLKISDARLNGQEIIGPFLVDIDNGKDLDASHNIAKQSLDYLIKHLKLTLKDLRIFFTGHKGFNIEIRPEAIAIKGSISEQIELSSKKLDGIIAALRDLNEVQDYCKDIDQGAITVHIYNDPSLVDSRGTHIDRIYGDRFGYGLKHPYIRLHDSINSWVGYDGKVKSRKKIEITYQELFEKSALEIVSESEQQAKS